MLSPMCEPITTTQDMCVDRRIKDIIDSITQEILDNAGITMPSQNDNLESLIQKLGGIIQVANESLTKETAIVKCGGPFMIMLEPNTASMPRQRRRFFLAQQIGHLYLHMGIANSEKWNKQPDGEMIRPTTMQQTLNNNYFASALLMPKREFLAAVKRFSDGAKVDTAKIAEYFDVTIAHASQRGKQLGVFR